MSGTSQPSSAKTAATSSRCAAGSRNAAKGSSGRAKLRKPCTWGVTDGVQRGNILEWDQPLSVRLKGDVLALQVNMEPRSILYSTLLLFGGTVVAAALTFAVAIWLIARKGRAGGPARP